MHKKLFIPLASFLLLFACNNSGQNNQNKNQDVSENETHEEVKKELKIGANSEINAEVLRDVADRLKEKEGIETEVILFTDYNQNHRALDQGEIDANVYSYFPFINTFNQENDGSVTPIAYSYISPMGVYGGEGIEQLEDIEPGSSVAIPNDPVTGGHALSVLEIIELIELDDEAGYMPTEEHITDNPYDLKFIGMPTGQLPRALDDVELAVMGATNSLDGGLSLDDALYIQSPEETPDYYKLTVAVHADRINDPTIQKYIQEYQTEETRDFALEVSDGSYVPIWSENDTTLEDFNQFVEEVNG